MCYICEARGTVGENYKAAQKEVKAAIRAVGKVPGWGANHDLTVPPPASKRLWSNADLKEYGEKWRREHLTAGGATARSERAYHPDEVIRDGDF